MNMFRVFMDLDKLDESKSIKESSAEIADRLELIRKLKALGKDYYKFSKYTNAQLFRMLEKAEAEKEEQNALRDYYNSKIEKPTCDFCGLTLTDGGYCPVCDDGKEDLDEWLTQSSTNSSQASTSSPQTAATNVVTIVYDSSKGKLRAQADDGAHGKGWVAFPNNLRNKAGQQYEVDSLIWNGKNYRASGNINPINSVSNTQNINENINKENYKMNFQTILEELDRLYEADQQIKAQEKAADQPEVKPEADIEEAKTESCDKALKEAAEDEEEILIDDEPVIDDESADDEEIDIEVEDDEKEEEPKQVVLECDNCGALLVKDESEVKVAEDSELVNVDEDCQFCEEAKGYKIIGAMVPYEAVEVEEAETVEEGLFSKKPTYALLVKYNGGGEANNAKSDWYCQATSSDPTKLEQKMASLKSRSDWSNVELKVVDMKTAKTLIHKDEHKDEFTADKNLDESIKEDAEELEELFDANVSLGVDGGTGNNVSVLSPGLNEKFSEEELEELFDANIGLSLDGGENNDVDVL